MRTHDPRQVAEDLRNHLATHDRRLSFLFGAGTSSAVNIAPDPPPGQKPRYEPLIPGIAGLTDLCGKAVCDLGKDQTTAWDVLATQCEKDGHSANIEDILSNVRTKMDAIGEGETLVGLDREDLVVLENKICATIARIVNPTIPECTPHNAFASWVKKVHRTEPIEVFTTNYDLLFETAFETARIPVFDGFVGTHEPFFYPECLEEEDQLPRPNWMRLWKLHGSINWLLTTTGGAKRIIRGRPAVTGELILPSNRKYDESRKQPYLGYIDRLSRTLNSEHALLITCGYSFRDDHINGILYGALDNLGTANVIALSFLDLDKDDDLVKEASRRSNLTVIAPNGGVISGTWGLWQLSQPVDHKTYAFMDTAFDSNGLPEDSGSPAAVSADLMGRMRIGNFNWFCRFLNSMGPDSQ